MRVIRSKLKAVALLPLIATVLALAQSDEAHAQSTTRSFQMALFVYPGDPPVTAADTDISMFTEGHGDPAPAPGRSIMIYQTAMTDHPLPGQLNDWSGIVAAVVDEPYTNALNSEFGGDQSRNPCGDPLRMAVVNRTSQRLAAAAAALKAVAPATRFWVNFHQNEIRWMQDSACPLALNQPYVDVISLDRYQVSFDTDVRNYYDWIVAHKATPQQQLALVPGTFIGNGSGVFGQAVLLAQYFAYAEDMNQLCNLGLGSQGVTGNFDGCPVWIVAGWLAGNSVAPQYIGLLDPSAAVLAAGWRNEVALPLRPDLAHQLSRGQRVAPLLQQLLLDN